jgi:hypothetical protein
MYIHACMQMFALRAVGILLPCFVVLRLISAIQQGQQQYQLEQIQVYKRTLSCMVEKLMLR